MSPPVAPPRVQQLLHELAQLPAWMVEELLRPAAGRLRAVPPTKRAARLAGGEPLPRPAAARRRLGAWADELEEEVLRAEKGKVSGQAGPPPLPQAPPPGYPAELLRFWRGHEEPVPAPVTREADKAGGQEGPPAAGGPAGAKEISGASNPPLPRLPPPDYPAELSRWWTTKTREPPRKTSHARRAAHVTEEADKAGGEEQLKQRVAAAEKAACAERRPRPLAAALAEGGGAVDGHVAVPRCFYVGDFRVSIEAEDLAAARPCVPPQAVAPLGAYDVPPEEPELQVHGGRMPEAQCPPQHFYVGDCVVGVISGNGPWPDIGAGDSENVEEVVRLEGIVAGTAASARGGVCKKEPEPVEHLRDLPVAEPFLDPEAFPALGPGNLSRGAHGQPRGRPVKSPARLTASCSELTGSTHVEQVLIDAPALPSLPGDQPPEYPAELARWWSKPQAARRADTSTIPLGVHEDMEPASPPGAPCKPNCGEASVLTECCGSPTVGNVGRSPASDTVPPSPARGEVKRRPSAKKRRAQAGDARARAQASAATSPSASTAHVTDSVLATPAEFPLLSAAQPRRRQAAASVWD